MTILNAHLEPRRALVVSNTQGVRDDGTPVYGSKIFALPHGPAAMAGRGQIVMWFNVFADCYASMMDFDGMVTQMARSASSRLAILRHEASITGTKAQLQSEMVLIGWSASRQAMACRYLSVSDRGVIDEQDVPDSFLSPWDSSWGDQPSVGSTSEAMATLAKRQAAHAERAYPGMGWLGNLTVCEITPESINFTSVKDFWK